MTARPCATCRPAAALRLAAGVLLALGAGLAQAQASLLDEQLGASLQAQPAPLVAPKPPLSTVVPSQVLRWRQEALALEHGENGMPRDPARAATLYCQAAQHGDAEAQFNLAWMLTNGRGIERDDAQAAHLFQAAAEQGMPQAQRMLGSMGTPRGEPPPCLRPLPVQPPEPVVARVQPGALGGPQRTAAAAAAPQPPVWAVPAVAPASAPAPIVNFVNAIAPDYKISPQLVLAIIQTESNFNPNAVSPKNAQGLMQLIPETAARFNVRNILDPAQNIRGGMAYLRWLLAYYEGNIALVAAAYNAGEGAVNRYRGVPPYAETLGYVAKVLSKMDRLMHPFDRSVTEPSPVLPLMRVAGAAPIATLRR